LKITVHNPIEYPAWDSLIETSHQTTFFHTTAWAQVLSESYGYKPLYFTALDNGRLTGIIPVMEIDSFITGKRGVSLPFTDICHPIAGSDDAFQELLDCLKQYGHRAGWKHIELRGGSGFLGDAPPFAEHFIHLLMLNGDEGSLIKSFRESTSRNVRKAEREGVEVSLHYTRDALASFYRLHCLTRRRHGLPPQPWSFFEKIHEYIIALQKGFVALAAHRDQSIAGAVYFLYRDHALFKFGASDRKVQYLRANNLVMWEAIRWFCRNGFRSLHFGRTESENEGLKQFKRGWSAGDGRVAYYRFDLKQNAFSAGRNNVNPSYPVFKILPMPLLRLAGSVLYRHVG
jgi:hypothetical protein